MSKPLNPIPFQIPSFRVLDSNGRSPPTLIHCFLERSILDISNPPVTIKAKNGEIYQAVYDNVVWGKEDTNIKVFISFQRHSYGNFAIIRNLTEPTAQKD